MTDTPTQHSARDIAPLATDDGARPSLAAASGLAAADDINRQRAWPLIAAVALAVLWTGGALAFLSGFHGINGLLQRPPEEIGGIVFMAAGPSLVFVLLGFMARQLARFSALAHGLEAAAQRLASPVEATDSQARNLADSIGEQVDRLSRSAEGALARLAAIDEVLRHHSTAVDEASVKARHDVDSLIQDLRRERAAIVSLSESLNDEARKISETIDRQAEMVTSAADLAAAHASEGRELLDQSSERLTVAAGQAQESGEKAAFSISEQMGDMEALVKALDERAARLEAVAGTHEANLKVAQNASRELTLAADAGSGAMRSAVDAAIEQARRLTDTIAEETRAAAELGATEIERVRRAAQSAEESAHSAQRSLESSASSMIERVERVNEANFEAAARTDEVIESRIRAVERVVAEVDDRLSNLPRAAEKSARGIREALQSGLSDVDRFAGEADDGAEDEFAQLEAARLSRSAKPGRKPRADAEPKPRRRGWGRRSSPVDELDEDAIEQLGRKASRHQGGRDDRTDRGQRMSRGDGLRRPSAVEEDFEHAFDRNASDAGANGRFDDDLDAYGFARRGRTNGASADPASSSPRRERDANGGWRWRDVLDELDEAPAGARVSDVVVKGLRRAGVDPADALDPDLTGRIARVRRRAGSGEARALVLDGALGDVRRTAAALAADPSLRARAEDFLDAHARQVRRAIDENDAGRLANLLDCDEGRAYLLVDAALSDV